MSNELTEHGRLPLSWADPLLLSDQINDEEQMVRDAVQAYCENRPMPRVLEAFRYEKADSKIFRKMGELGLLDPTIPPI